MFFFYIKQRNDKILHSIMNSYKNSIIILPQKKYENMHATDLA